MDRPIAALKRLLELVNNAVSAGRPGEAFRRSYDLPAARLAFNSFEVAFARPQQDPLMLTDGRSVYDVCADRLGEALAWLHSSSADEGLPPDPAMLDVLKELAPPAHGQVVRAEIRGQIVSGDSAVTLTRDDRAVVTRAIARLGDQPRVVQLRGRVGEFDHDNQTFTLRDIEDGRSDQKCSFGEEHYDDLFEALGTQSLVTVIARYSSTRKHFDVVAVQARGQLPGGTLPGG